MAALRVPLAGWLFAAICLYAFVSFLPSGLWEDGYFFIRYARNTWQHGVIAWNVADGPVHGMTSQLYQALVTLLYPLAPTHLVLVSKSLAALALLGAALCLFRLLPEPAMQLQHLALVFLGLSAPLVLQHVTTGLETLVVLPWLALWTREYLAYRAGGSSAARMALFVVGAYLLRPDAVLMLLVALAPCLREQARRTLAVYAIASIGIAACLAAFKLYYGTALPLSFYVKSYLTTTHAPEYLQLFWREKVKNLAQFCYYFAPFYLVALTGRTRAGLALLAGASALCAYHALFTVEVMGHHSRFYIPAVPLIVAAAVCSWRQFRDRAPRYLPIACCALWLLAYPFLKRLDHQSGVYLYIHPALELPYLAAMALLLWPGKRLPNTISAGALVGMTIGIVAAYPVTSLAFSSDESILLAQIAPRRTFRGLRELMLMKPAHVYHTDMGAPGVLLPESELTDLDGLLSEEIAIEHKSFAELCERDRPDAIFMPLAAVYPALHADMLASRCLRDYQAASRSARSRLMIRADRYAAYRQAARRLARP